MYTSESPRRTRLLASALLIMTFVVGALVGAAGNRLLSAREPDRRAGAAASERESTDRERDRRGPRGRMVDPRLLDEIGVTAQQRARIDAILELRDREAKLLWKDMEPRINAVVKQARGEVRAELTAEQVQKLDSLIAERRARWRQNRENGQASRPHLDTTKNRMER